MAGYSQEALDAEMANIGRPNELVAQIEAQERCEQVIADLEGTAISPSDLFATVEEKVSAVTEQVALSDDCNINFSPNLISLVSLMMTAISNPEGARLAGLQLLMNTLKIKPPGFNLPSFDLDLNLPNISLPNISLPSLDFGLSLLGGFDMGSMLKGVAGLLAIPPIGGCGVLLPDIAKKVKDIIPETGLPEGETGGLANPMKTLGNKFVKQGFDKDGNPYQIAFQAGSPAKIAQSEGRSQAQPATLGNIEPPGYAGGGLQDNTVTRVPVKGATLGNIQPDLPVGSGLQSKVGTLSEGPTTAFDNATLGSTNTLTGPGGSGLQSGGLYTEEQLDAGLGTASRVDATASGGLQSNAKKIKPPIYESVDTGLGQSTILEKNNDPVFSELIKQNMESGLATTMNQSEFDPLFLADGGGEGGGSEYAAELSLRGTNYGQYPGGINYKGPANFPKPTAVIEDFYGTDEDGKVTDMMGSDMFDQVDKSLNK